MLQLSDSWCGPHPVTYCLCSLRQVSQPLCASVSLSEEKGMLLVSASKDS